VDAAANVPQDAACERMQIAILSEGTEPGQESPRSNGGKKEKREREKKGKWKERAPMQAGPHNEDKPPS